MWVNNIEPLLCVCCPSQTSATKNRWDPSIKTTKTKAETCKGIWASYRNTLTSRFVSGSRTKHESFSHQLPRQKLHTSLICRAPSTFMRLKNFPLPPTLSCVDEDPGWALLHGALTSGQVYANIGRGRCWRLRGDWGKWILTSVRRAVHVHLCRVWSGYKKGA